MRYLTVDEVLDLHRRIILQSGGYLGVRDHGALVSAISQPRMTFDNVDLYPGIVEKAAALCFSLIMNHAFVDGNKRTGHAAMETFLILNGYELDTTSVNEQERIILGVAAGQINRERLTEWLMHHIHREQIIT